MATRWFDELAAFEDEIGDVESSGTLTVAAEAPVLRYQLPRFVDAFAREQRHAQLRLLSRRPLEIIELVRRNEIDLGIIDRRPLPSEVNFHPWRTFQAFVLIPRGHPLARRGPPALDSILNEATLLRYPQVVGEIDERDQNRLREGLERLGLPYNVVLEVGNIETVKYYVARGHGIAVIPGLCLSDEDAAIFHLIEIPEELEGETSYGVILREGKHISSALKSFLGLLDVPSLSG